MKKLKLATLFLAAGFLIQLFAPVPAYAVNTGRFTDVPETHPYHDEIYQAVELGLFTGTSSTSFSPDQPMTRGMLAAILSRLDGVTTLAYRAKQYSDVPAGAWYAAPVAWASKTGIASGTSAGFFSPNQGLTWGELIEWLTAYAAYAGIDEAVCDGLLPDSANVQGVPTRGEAAAALLRLCGDRPYIPA